MKQRVFDHLRDSLLRGIVDPPARKPPLEQLRQSEWLPEFERLMRNRLIMGSIRYGSIQRAELGGYDLTSTIRTALERYEATGNLEYLVDAANLCMYEFRFSSHPARHFVATDDTDHVQVNHSTNKDR